MTFDGHHHELAPSIKEANIVHSDDKELETIQHFSRTSTGGQAEHDLRPRRTFEAPELIRNLTVEERVKLEAKLVRKIDFRLLPMVILCYIMNYLDRNNIAAARLAGLESDLNLKGVQYQVGYVSSQVLTDDNMLKIPFVRPASRSSSSGIYLCKSRVICF